MGYEVSEANMLLEQVRKLIIGGVMILMKVKQILILIVLIQWDLMIRIRMGMRSVVTTDLGWQCK
jgi:hypothetical protein